MIKTRTKKPRTSKRNQQELTQREKQNYFEELLVARAAYQLEGALARKAMTQRELAALLKVSAAAVSQVLDAEANPTLRTLARYAAALDCEVKISISDRASMPRAATEHVHQVQHQLSAIALAAPAEAETFLQEEETPYWNVISMASYKASVDWKKDTANGDLCAAVS